MRNLIAPIPCHWRSLTLWILVSVRDVLSRPSSDRFRTNQLADAAKSPSHNYSSAISPMDVYAYTSNDRGWLIQFRNDLFLELRTHTYPCEPISRAASVRCIANKPCRRSPRRRGTRCRKVAEPLLSSLRWRRPGRNDTHPRSVPVVSRRLPASLSNRATGPVASSTLRSTRGNSFFREKNEKICLTLSSSFVIHHWLKMANCTVTTAHPTAVYFRITIWNRCWAPPWPCPRHPRSSLRSSCSGYRERWNS